MQSGTLVPAAKNVIPMITSGMSKVKLIMVTFNKEQMLKSVQLQNEPYNNNSLRCFHSGTVSMSSFVMSIDWDELTIHTMR